MSEGRNKFDGLFAARRGSEIPQQEYTEEETTSDYGLPRRRPVRGRKRRGRPPGKRSNPDYEQVTAYVRRNTHQEVKIELLREGRGRQFSDLVEELLQEWLGDRQEEDRYE